MRAATVADVMAVLEAWAPPAWAEPWDNVGLQVGDPADPAGTVLCALEVTDAVLAEARERGAGLLVVHHPLIFKPLKALRWDSGAAARRLRDLVRAGLAVYAAHTNLDVAPGGTNDLLAERVGLTRWDVLQPAGEERPFKLVTFVPRGHEGAVREAVAAAGAGVIGAYSHCTFQSPGTGTFKPLPGANPFQGQVGALEYAEELRLEVLVPAGRLPAAISAMRAAHPYEEVAYDIYPLANGGVVRGHGRVGELAAPVTLGELAERVKAALGAPAVRMAGDPDRRLTVAATGAGSGASLIRAAAARGAQVLVAGDMDHHDAHDALDLGMALIDPGHFATEQPVVAALAARLQAGLAARDAGATVVAASAGRDPLRPT